MGAGVSGASSAAGYSKPGFYTIDCQSHIFVPELVAHMEKRKQSPYAYRKDGHTFVVVGEWVRKLMPHHMDITVKLSDMDAAGIDLTALSINDPGPELFGKDGPAVARMVHDFIADIARKYPQRFFGLATLPLLDMDASLQEMDRCVSKLGFKGVLLYSNIDGKFPDEPQFHPLFEHAEKLGIPILLHPAYPTTYDETKGYSMAAGLGLMFDTTIAMARIVLSGLLDKHPNLKIVHPHVGGALPYLVGRIDHQTQVLKRGAENITKAPSEYLKHIYTDAVSPIAMAIRYGVDFFGSDRMLYSSDHPWVDPKLIVSLIKSLNLPAEQQHNIFGGNAKTLFKL
jgi:predicted TIM-barrel fold metal-dependent hydrolase